MDDGDGVDRPYEGFIAFDDAFDNLPGLVLEHQFFGEGQNEDYYATFWAQNGFFAFAADIYGVGIRPDNPDDAAANLTFLESQPELFRARLLQSFELLFTFANVDRAKGGAAIGFCLGGDSVFELARSAPPELRAIFAFHPTTAGVLGEIGVGLNNDVPSDVWVQSHKGTLDQASLNADLIQLQADLDAAQVLHYTTFVYGDSVDHGFSLPFEDAYDQAAAEQGLRSVSFVLARVFPSVLQPFFYGKLAFDPPCDEHDVTWPKWASLSKRT
jgi:dienelactone hydrolase